MTVKDRRAAKIPPEVIRGWAQRVADSFDARDPAGALARVHIRLAVFAEALRTSQRIVYGAWDPHLRRIELYACGAARSDVEIVTTLAHELWHMTSQARQRVVHARPAKEDPADEAAAKKFATALLKQFGAARVNACAKALRRLAQPGPGA